MSHRITHLLSSIILLVAAAGCHSTGLSPREAGARNVTAYLLSLYNTPDVPSAPPPQLTLPARIGVAQVGEIAPPQELVDHLRAQPGLFARVEGIPGLFDAGELDYYHPNDEPQRLNQRIHDQLQRMQRFASDLGVDYLFLYGGTIDYGSRENGLQVLDLTIVGAFVVPSRNVKALAKASGALIDLHTGRAVFLVTAESQKDSLASATGQDAAEARLLDRLRDDVTRKLAERFISECSRRKPLALSR